MLVFFRFFNAHIFGKKYPDGEIPNIQYMENALFGITKHTKRGVAKRRQILRIL